jgi:hypothetical protein
MMGAGERGDRRKRDGRRIKEDVLYLTLSYCPHPHTNPY